MMNTERIASNKWEPGKDTEQVYSAFNEQVATLMTETDKIVFSPAEDFEYKVPLEDFKNSRKTQPY